MTLASGHWAKFPLQCGVDIFDVVVAIGNINAVRKCLEDLFETVALQIKGVFRPLSTPGPWPKGGLDHHQPPGLPLKYPLLFFLNIYIAIESFKTRRADAVGEFGG